MLHTYKCSGGGNATFLRDLRTLLACKGFFSAYEDITFLFLTLFYISLMFCEIFRETMPLGPIFAASFLDLVCDGELSRVKSM